nr:unnamed protein product [Spirometra erinaceieuropaei]
MKPRLPLQGSNFATIVSVYVPTMTGPAEAITNLCEDLRTPLATAQKADRLVGLGDFNARARTHRLAWRRALGPYGIAGCNDSDFILLRTYAEHHLILINAFSRLSIWKTTTRIHPPIAALDVIVIKTICEADGWTDHRPIISKLRFRLQTLDCSQGRRDPGIFRSQ